MNSPKIKIPKSSIERFYNNVPEIFETGEIAEGKFTDLIETELVKQINNAKHGILVNSNGSGIATMLCYYRSKSRNKVLIQSNTMYGVKTIPQSLKMEVIIIPSDINIFVMDYNELLNYFLDNEVDDLIVVYSHIGGCVGPNIIEIARLCKKYGVPLIEDSAHTFGSQYTLYGDALIYSFYATKSVPGGEAGIIITNNSNAYDFCTRFISYDRVQMTMNDGMNMRIGEIAACFLWSVICDTLMIIDNRMKIYELYNKICDSIGIEYYEANGPFGSHDYLKHSGYKFIITDKKAIDYLTFVTDNEVSQSSVITPPVFGYSLSENIPKIDHICLNTNYCLNEEIIEKTINILEKY